MSELLFCGKVLGIFGDWEFLDEDEYHFFDFVPAEELWDDSTPRTIYFNHKTGVIQFYDDELEEVKKTVQLVVTVE